MKNNLLISTSIAVLLAASNAMAADDTNYQGSVNLDTITWVQGNSTLDNADISVKYNSSDQSNNDRLSFAGTKDSNNTITVIGDNTIKNKVTLEVGNHTAVAGSPGASLTVNGYLTVTDDGGKQDLSAINLKIANDGNDIGEGELVVAGNGLTVGNTTFEKDTSIYTFADADINLAAGKTMTFAENNKIYGAGDLTVKGAAGSNVDITKGVAVDVDTTFDGGNVNISDHGVLNLADGKTITFDNANVNMDGAPNGAHNGITGGDGTKGTVTFGEGTKTVNITNGAAIAVGDVNLEGGVYNVDGKMAVHNAANPAWTAGSQIQGDNSLVIGSKATVNLTNGGLLTAGYPDSGESSNAGMAVNGTVNMDNGIIRAASKQDGSEAAKFDVAGTINVLKNKVGTIASRVTDVLTGGAVNIASGATLNIVPDMNRGANSDVEPTLTGNEAFNVAGSLINSGTINSQKVDINIKGDTVANQAKGGQYVASNSTLNGNLTLSGVDNSAEGADKQLAAAPKADFYGANTINGEVKNTQGLITINQGGSLTVKNGSSNEDLLTNNGIIDLAGSLNANVDGAGQITVQNSAAHITSFTGNELEIAANSSSSSLVSEASTAAQIYVNKGVNFTIDNDKIATDDLVTYGNVKLAADYSSAKVKVGDAGTLNLGSNKLTSSSGVNLWGGSTLVFNVDKAAAGSVAQAGGQIDGKVITNFNTGETATINPVVGLEAGSGTYTYATGGVDVASGTAASDFNLTHNNAIYNVEFDSADKSILNINKKTSGEVTDSVVSSGGTINNANTVNAWVGGNSNAAALTGASKEMAERLNVLAQTDPHALAEATTALAPEVNATVQSTATENANQIFGAVGSRLSGGSMAGSSQGMSSGDSYMSDAAVWAQGLYNYAKMDDTSHARGFDADTTGAALGIEKYITNDVKIGAGYAYSTTDIDGYLRTTDVDTNTAILYGEYKPSQWYVNGIATYGWSKYKEKKHVAGIDVKADYDTDVFGFQTMTGYDMYMNTLKVTPEAGLRYVNIKRDSYQDTAGQRVNADSSDILTGVIGAKASKDYTSNSGMIIRPEARVAMTYDFMNDDSNSVVSLANGSAYQVEGKALDRLGFEFGAGLTAEVNPQVELSLGYEGRFRQDYQDHTGLLNAKYKF